MHVPAGGPEIWNPYELLLYQMYISKLNSNKRYFGKS